MTERDEQEHEQRFNDLARRMLAMPHKPHEPLSAGSVRETHRKASSAGEVSEGVRVRIQLYRWTPVYHWVWQN